MDTKDIFNEPQTDFNNFDFSREHKTTFRFGRLYPVEMMEVNPGEYMEINTSTFMRFLPMVTPVMHRVRTTQHWYFVPNRIMWKDWEKFITGEDPNITAPVVESFAFTGMGKDKIGGYMGLPLTGSSFTNISAFPLKAYMMIYNDYYRHQHMELKREWELHDGVNLFPITPEATSYDSTPLYKNWEKNYYTRILIAAQKGVPVKIPIVASGQTMDILLRQSGTGHNKVLKQDRTALPGFAHLEGAPAPNKELYVSGIGPMVIDPNGEWYLDTQNAATIEAFRAAVTLQKFYELDWQSDLKYNDIIKAHFRTNVQDYRLDMPEYLGGSVSNVQVSEVLSQTESLNEGTYVPLGAQAGRGILADRSDTIRYKVREHGWIVCIQCTTPDHSVINRGLHKKWTRLTRLQYMWPSFASLGDQPVYNNEIYYPHAHGNNVFGYAEPYAEYKQNYDIVSGEFQGSLKNWHLACDLPNNIVLGYNFLKVEEQFHDLDRIFFADGDVSDYILCQLFFDIKISRQLPKFNVPDFNY